MYTSCVPRFQGHTTHPKTVQILRKKQQNDSHSELNNVKSNPSENSLELVGKS
jgi:hypothetical protein